MDRRGFVKAGIAASVMAGARAKAAPVKKQRPNVLYVFGDQHRAASMPGEPYCEVIAPNIDAFRRANFSMDTCVSNYPVCTPYRGILMTGKYPAQTGLIGNANEGSKPGDTLAMKTSEITLTKTFKNQGYHTGYVGKWHLGGDGAFTPPGPRRFDIDEWHTWGDTASHYKSFTFDPVSGTRIRPEGWSPTFMTDQAVSFVKAQPKGANAAPWFLVLSWNPPHPPFDPPTMDQKPYAGDLKRRPNYKPVSAAASASAAEVKGGGKKGGGKKSATGMLSDEEMHVMMQGYYGGITGIDLEFAKVMKALDESGQADNTIVIFTSDHGEMMGSQGRMAKGVPFEEAVRVPFLVRYPGVTAKGASSKALFSAIDIYPTVCGLANVPVPAHCMGKDLSGILRGKKVDAPEISFLMAGWGDKLGSNGKKKKAMTEHIEPGGSPSRNPGGEEEAGVQEKQVPHRGARTTTHTYAVTEEARWILYDNVADPYQLNNLAKDPAHAGLMASLDVKIQAWMKETGDTTFTYPSLV